MTNRLQPSPWGRVRNGSLLVQRSGILSSPSLFCVSPSGGVMLVHDIRRNKSHLIDFRESAPGALREEALQRSWETKVGRSWWGCRGAGKGPPGLDWTWGCLATTDMVSWGWRTRREGRPGGVGGLPQGPVSYAAGISVTIKKSRKKRRSGLELEERSPPAQP